MTQTSIMEGTKRPVAAFTGALPDPAIPTVNPGAPIAQVPIKTNPLLQWHDVRFTMQPQQELEWCWAADAASIDGFFDHTSTLQQCTVVNMMLNRKDCCVDPGSDACNRSFSMKTTLTAIRRLRHHLTRALSFDEVVQEIDQGRPVVAHITWPTAPGQPPSGHLPVIVGYQLLFQTLAVADSLYTSQEVRYTVFKTSYMQQGGVWNESYYLK